MGETLYVTNAPNSDEVSVINIANKSVNSIAVDGNTSGVGVEPDGDLVYVAAGDADLIYIINTTTDSIVDTIEVSNPSSYGTFITREVIPPAIVPTLSEWGLIAMAGILGIVGFIVIRRKKVSA
jgi:YVTN family beta-propeller protein